MTVRRIEHGAALEFEMWLSPDRWDRVSAWLLPGGLMIDAGGARTAAELLEQARGLEAVFLGHWHEDHSGGAARMARAGVPVHAGRLTARRVRRPAAIPGYRSEFWGEIEPVRALALPEGGPLRPLPLPGHSPDQVGYLDERSGILCSGDLALRRFQRVAMPGEDPHAMIDSIHAVLALQPSALATSHRGLLLEWRPYLEEQLAYLEETRGRARELRAEGRTVREIVREMYGGEARTPDGREWRQFSDGEFSTARWVAQLIGNGGAAASSPASRPPRAPSARSRARSGPGSTAR